MRSRPTTAVAALLLTTSLLAASATDDHPASAAAGPAAVPRAGASASAPDREIKAGLVPGVTYTAKSISGPNRIKIVTVDPSSDATIDVATATNSLPGYTRTSTMGFDHNAVAAINGDFGLPPGRPGHALAEDANLMQTSPLGNDGKNFAIRANEAKAFIGSPQIKIHLQRAGGERSTIERWNDGAARASEIAGFTNYGGNVADPSGGMCSVRLLPDGAPDWSPDQAVERAYDVGAVDCGGRMPLGDGVVLTTPTSGGRADELRRMDPGERVTITWSFGWPGVIDAIGGSPLLIEKGKIKVKSCGSYLCQRHPRSAVGIKKNGDVMLVQVDGRDAGSRGMTLVQLARAMKARGAAWAMNLDGGGSSTMWIRGKGVVNEPSDGGERGVTSALIVLPGRDQGDPQGLLKSLAPPDAALTASFEASLTDPGSTGGLLDAVDAGDVPGRVPAELAPILRTFRSAQDLGEGG